MLAVALYPFLFFSLSLSPVKESLSLELALPDKTCGDLWLPVASSLAAVVAEDAQPEPQSRPGLRRRGGGLDP